MSSRPKEKEEKDLLDKEASDEEDKEAIAENDDKNIDDDDRTDTETSDEEDDDKEKGRHYERNSAKYLFIAVGAVLLIIAAIIFMPKNTTISPDSAYTYNYFTFTNIDGAWTTEVQSDGSLVTVALRYGPKQVEDIPVTGTIIDFARSNSFSYISLDPKDKGDANLTFAVAEVAVKLARHWDLETSCSMEDEYCANENITIVTCEDAAAEKAVITFDKSQESAAIEIKGNCAIIKGRGDELIRAADRFMLGMYGIMK